MTNVAAKNKRGLIGPEGKHEMSQYRIKPDDRYRVRYFRMTRPRYLRMLHFAIFSVAHALQFPYPYRDIQTALSAEAGAVAEFNFAHCESVA